VQQVDHLVALKMAVFVRVVFNEQLAELLIRDLLDVELLEARVEQAHSFLERKFANALMVVTRPVSIDQLLELASELVVGKSLRRQLHGGRGRLLNFIEVSLHLEVLTSKFDHVVRLLRDHFDGEVSEDLGQLWGNCDLLS